MFAQSDITFARNGHVSYISKLDDIELDLCEVGWCQILEKIKLKDKYIWLIS